MWMLCVRVCICEGGWVCGTCTCIWEGVHVRVCEGV